MDQLYTYQILQELRKYDCDDFFIDIIWPAIIMFATIWSSVWLSKNEFKRQLNKERNAIIKENNEFIDYFKSVLTLALTTLKRDCKTMPQAVRKAYDLDKGITPFNPLGIYKELDIVDSLDRHRLEKYYQPYFKKDDFRSVFYNALNAVSRQINYYSVFSNEIININGIVSSYDSVLLEKHESIMHYSSKKLIEYFEHNKENREIEKEEATSFLSILSSYNSDVNNFSILHENIEKLEKHKVFTILMGGVDWEYHQLKRTFIIDFLKLKQETDLFNIRMDYLFIKMASNVKMIESFLEMATKIPEK